MDTEIADPAEQPESENQADVFGNVVGDNYEFVNEMAMALLFLCHPDDAIRRTRMGFVVANESVRRGQWAMPLLPLYLNLLLVFSVGH